MSIARGIYRHISSYGCFKVHGVARSHSNPEKMMVVYSQQYNDILNGTKDLVHLPYGTMWTRDLDDFKKRFKLIRKEDDQESNKLSEENYDHLYQ